MNGCLQIWLPLEVPSESGQPQIPEEKREELIAGVADLLLSVAMCREEEEVDDESGHE